MDLSQPFLFTFRILPLTFSGSLLFAVLCGFFAYHMKRSVLLWGFLGLIGHWVALLILVLLNDEELEAPDETATESAEESTLWFYDNHGEIAGPVDGRHVLNLLKGDELSVDSLVWTEGMEDWTPIRKSRLHAQL